MAVGGYGSGLGFWEWWTLCVVLNWHCLHCWWITMNVVIPHPPAPTPRNTKIGHFKGVESLWKCDLCGAGTVLNTGKMRKQGAEYTVPLPLPAPPSPPAQPQPPQPTTTNRQKSNYHAAKNKVQKTAPAATASTCGHGPRSMYCSTCLVRWSANSSQLQVANQTVPAPSVPWTDSP